MTRKKSNVKALALAVTCAILAGGYSGLNPVYAAVTESDLHYLTKYDKDGQILSYIVPGSGGGSVGGTTHIQKINFGKVMLDGSDASNVYIRSYDGKFIVSNEGAITATSLKLGEVDVAGSLTTLKANTGALETKTTNISYNATTGTTVEGVVLKDKGITAADGKFTVKADGQTVFTGDPDDKGKTTIKNGETVVEGANGKVTINNGGIEIAQKAQDTGENYSIKLDSGYVDASGYVKAPKFYIDNDNKFEKNSLSVAGVDSNGNQQYVRIGGGTISASGDVNVVGSLNTNTIGEATTGTGVTVDGVTFKAGAVSGVSGINDDIIQFTQNGTENIVQINSDLRLNDNTGGKAAILSVEGLSALNSMVYDEHDKINNDADGKPVIKAGNGSVVGGVKLDNKNITNVDSITVNEGEKNQVQITSEGIVVGLTSAAINGDGFYAGGHNYNDAKAALDGKDGKIKGAGGKFGVDEYGNVTTTGDIKGKDVTVDGKLSANGDAVVGGDLSVTGKANFTQDATFAGGITTDAINEATADKGVTIDGVWLKDQGISAAGGAFTVEGATGNVKTAGNIEGENIKANGALKGASLDVTNDATVGGNLNVTKDAAVGGKLDVTGDTTLKGKLDVTGDTTLKGKLGVTGAASLDSTLDVTGKATLKDELQVDKKATFGTAAGSQTVINGGDITADGRLKAKSATIGAVGITDTGIVTGVTKLTTKDLEVTGLLNISGDIAAKNISGDSLTVTGAIKGASLEVTGAVNGATINGATITTNSFNGATIGATTFNGVTLTTDGDVSGRHMTASGTITGKEITDGAGASMNAGTVKGKEITDGVGFTASGGNVTAKDINATTGTIAGVGFAANNVSGISNLTATGTIQGATLKVNDNNLLDSNGLKAEKAVIDNLTIDGASITSNNADGSVGVAGITVDKTGAITGVKAIDGVAVAGNTASGLTIGSGATAVTIGGNSLALSSTNFSVDDDGDVIGQSFTSGASHLKDGELKLNAANIWNTTEGIKAEKAVIGANTLDAAGISTTGTLGVKGQATFGDSTSGNYTTVNGGKVDITANGGSTTIEGAKITTKTLDVEDIILRNEMKDGTGATINIKGSDGSMSVASGKFAVDKDGQLTNKISGTAGGFSYETKLETSTSGIKANYTNAINGNQNIIDMGASGISIGVVSGTTPSVGAGFKAELDAATMGYGTANSIVVNKDTIKSALGTDVTRVMTNSATEQSIVDKVGAASRSLTADEIVDAAGGMTITTNNTGTTFSNGTNTTLINGSAITSTNGGATGVLDGSNLTLTNGANSTALTAGGATFTGADGRSDATGVKNQTTIDGGIITTDTLNVQRIELGDKLVDSNGTPHGSNLSMDKQGNFSAAGGNFKVVGVTGADKGAFTNTVGNTTLQTGTNGASMNYAGTANSNISVADGKAAMSVGANAAVTATDGKVEIKGGTQTVTTTDAGTVFANGSSAVRPGGVTTTTINGNEITTGKLTTDQLVITGSGAAAGAGTGTIALGGDGSIKSNIKDAATGKEATFQTNADGTFTHAKDGANETTNTVNAQGNTNKVTDGTNTSTVTQTATSIGGVVTNGTVTMKQELTADGVKFEQTGHDEVNIAKGDVTVKNNRNAATPGQEVHLSDLGSLNNLDGELAARDEYQDNKTAVGAINAEAGIRREEVARLDNRIDDVNNRVDKVGAMAAAIASLKSIGYDPQAPSEFSIGLGQYKGETGVAMGFFHYPNKNFMINVSLSTAGGETMGGIGATWRFGHKSPQKLLDEQREAQAKKELAAAEKYQAAAKLAKEAQERAEYAAKLARQAQVSADNAKAAADATQAKHFQ